MNKDQIETVNDLIDHSIETICKVRDNPRPEAKENLELLRDANDNTKTQEFRDDACNKLFEKVDYSLMDKTKDSTIDNDVDRLILENGVFYGEAKLEKLGDFGEEQKSEVEKILMEKLNQKITELKMLSKETISKSKDNLKSVAPKNIERRPSGTFATLPKSTSQTKYSGANCVTQ